MIDSPIPRPPAGLGPRGRNFWREVLRALELDPSELALLSEICRVVDRLQALDAAVRAHGVLGPSGKPTPALVESRAQAIVLARLLASLRLPDDFAQATGEGETVSRPQRRGAARGVYALPSREVKHA